MIVLDAFAVLALLKGEPAAPQVRELLAGGLGARLTAAGLAEVVDHLVRLAGASEDEAALDIAQLGLADAMPIDTAIGFSAGQLRARHYHRRSRPVSLADCVAAASAQHHAAPLASSDPHLLDLCQDEQIQTIPLPDGSGRLRGA